MAQIVDDQEESEDYSTFFLQPASSPYNIVERIQQANLELFNASLSEDKSPKVKFKEDLVSYDAQLTDDDVMSIESDQSDIAPIEQGVNKCIFQTLEYKALGDADISDIEEEDEEEEIIEEIENELNTLNLTEPPFSDTIYEHDSVIKQEFEDIEVYQIVDKSDKSDQRCEEEVSRSSETETVNDHNSKKPIKKSKVKSPKSPSDICCKLHCLEQIELGLPMRLIELLENKQANCPPLKLLERKCCSDLKSKYQNHLPYYNGCRSEYGLSTEEIEKAKKNRERARLRKQRKQQQLEENRRKRTEENERVFREWLENIKLRKLKDEAIANDNRRNRCIRCGSSTKLLLLSYASNQNNKKRPTTSYHSAYKLKQKLENRPHTTSSKVYIQMPNHNYLKISDGVDINHLLLNGNLKHLRFPNVS